MVPIVSENKTINDSIKVSLSCNYSDYENENVLLIQMTKKHKMFDLDFLPIAPKTPTTRHASIDVDEWALLIDVDEWALYNMAPLLKKQKTLFVSDDCIRTAPRFPLLDNADDSIVDINVKLASRLSYWMEEAPRLPYLDGDDDNYHYEKDNLPPPLILLPRFVKYVLT